MNATTNNSTAADNTTHPLRYRVQDAYFSQGEIIGEVSTLQEAIELIRQNDAAASLWRCGLGPKLYPYYIWVYKGNRCLNGHGGKYHRNNQTNEIFRERLTGTLDLIE